MIDAIRYHLSFVSIILLFNESYQDTFIYSSLVNDLVIGQRRSSREIGNEGGTMTNS